MREKLLKPTRSALPSLNVSGVYIKFLPPPVTRSATGTPRLSFTHGTFREPRRPCAVRCQRTLETHPFFFHHIPYTDDAVRVATRQVTASFLFFPYHVQRARAVPCQNASVYASIFKSRVAHDPRAALCSCSEEKKRARGNSCLAVRD